MRLLPHTAAAVAQSLTHGTKVPSYGRVSRLRTAGSRIQDCNNNHNCARDRPLCGRKPLPGRTR